MRNCGQILEKEIKRQHVLRKDISEFIGISPQNLSKLLRKANLETNILERACQFLNLDPADFFDYRPEYAASTRVGDIDQHHFEGTASVALGVPSPDLYERLLESKDTLLESKDKLLAEKDKRIELLEATVQMLKSQLTDKKASPSVDA